MVLKRVKKCIECGCLFICNHKAYNDCRNRKECFCEICSKMSLTECEVTTIRHSK